MNKIEEQIFNRTTRSDKIILWTRYAYNIFCMFKETEDEVNNLCDEINQINTYITFTSEIEVNNKINFLDMAIGKRKRQLEIEVHRNRHTQTQRST